MRPPCSRITLKLVSYGFALLALALTACGGGGGGSDSSGTANQSNSASSTASSTSSGAASSAGNSSSTASSTGSTSSGIYLTAPNIATCNTGQLKDSERTGVLDKLNAVRARHGLPAVSYDSSFDGAAAEAALYMVANKALTHSPDSSGPCYTSNAASLAGTSNLHLSWTSAATTQNIASSDAIVGYLVDDNVASLGHRRWVLYPFLNKTTYGRVDGQPAGTSSQYMASALKVIGNAASSVTMANDFVAYPYGNYPASEFAAGWYLSFSVVASKTSAAANGSAQVSFAGASITVSNAGTPLAVSGQLADYTGYGLPNSLQWKVAGLQTNVTYSVQIDNVIVNGVTRQYNYTFRLQ
ncbi:MAG TPA: CAP domain-containing protein [Rhodocyclaceae bacterium]|nr:CAP domain-containing protein [Rhodocyclaceae bacterium]